MIEKDFTQRLNELMNMIEELKSRQELDSLSFRDALNNLDDRFNIQDKRRVRN
jgi:hypothetical protein